MDKPTLRPIEFICPFADGCYRCTEWMSPVRETPSHMDRKLFVLMERLDAPTKVACTHCGLFMSIWKQKTGIRGHLRYFWLWLTRPDIRNDLPLKR